MDDSDFKEKKKAPKKVSKKENSPEPKPKGRPKQPVVELKSDPSDLTSSFSFERPVSMTTPKKIVKKSIIKKPEEEEDPQAPKRKYKIKMMEAENIEAEDMTMQDI